MARGDNAARRNGPAPGEHTREESMAVTEEFKAGDPVAIKLSTIRNPTWRRMTPRVLLDAGWPNRFQVMGSCLIDGEPHVSLFPCCFWMTKKVQGNKYLCKGHPAVLFEKIQGERGWKPGDAHASIQTPFGPLAEMDYLEGDEPVFTLRIGGWPIQINSKVATQIKDIFREKGIL